MVPSAYERHRRQPDLHALVSGMLPVCSLRKSGGWEDDGDYSCGPFSVVVGVGTAHPGRVRFWGSFHLGMMGRRLS